MSSLDGVRVLIVEDNFIVADSLKMLIDSYGGTVTALAPSAAAALEALDSAAIDVAILDIHLAGGKVDPLADRLVSEGVPFLFLTGYRDKSVLPEHLQGFARLGKPVEGDKLVAAIRGLLGRE